MTDYGLPEEWARVRLDEVATVNPRRPKVERGDATLTTFVPMPAVDGRFGTIAEPLEREFSTVKKGYTYFEEGDVIFAKITPCMQNGKHAVARDLIDGIGYGSTEFHVIRPGQRVSAEWLWLFLRQPRLLEAFTGQFVGSVGQQRLPDARLRELSIPLPPLATQERIALEVIDALAETEDARDVATRLGARARLLERAVIREAFERLDEVGTERKALTGRIEVIRGVTYEKHEASTEPVEGRVCLIRTGAVQQDVEIERDVLWVPKERVSAAKMLRRGDIVMAVSSSLALAGKTAILREDWDGTIGAFCSIIRTGAELLPEYLALWFRSPQFEAWRPANVRATTNIANLNLAALYNVAIPVPSIDHQRAFVRQVEAQVDSARHFADAYVQSLRSIAKTREEILTQAFEGGI